MCDNSESFRNEIAVKLASILSPDQLHSVLAAVDTALSNYDISKKETSIITTDGIPETVKWFLGSKAVENKSKGTIRQYHYKLINFFSTINKPVQDITANDIRIYLYQYKQNNHNSDSTVDGTRRVLNAYFSWLVNNEYLLRNPVSKVAKIKYQTKERKPLSSYELELIRWHCKNIREKALVDFLFSTGCRVSECSNVKLSDIDWNNRSVVIQHGKGDKCRVVFFNAESELSLRKYLETRNDSNDYLFVCTREPHKQLSVRAIQLSIKSIASRIDINKKTTPHVFRHTFATTGIKRGMPLERLQALMGHSKLETTMIYAKLDFTDIQKEHQRVYA